MRTDYSYPEGKAVKVWNINMNSLEIQCSLVLQDQGHYCGYCRFPSRPLIEEKYRGFATYVPVHGGITYAKKEEDGTMVYGFDCAHADDDYNPLCKDIDWLMSETEKMAIGIMEASRYEKDYLTAKDTIEKAKIIDDYHEHLEKKYGIKFDIMDNLGAMVNLLIGEL